MPQVSASETMMWSQLGNEIVQGDNGITSMLPILILSLIFAAGFGLGYAARAWRSYKRRTRHLMYSPYTATPRSTTFGHARRAF
jgi:hypothetical protein